MKKIIILLFLSIISCDGQSNKDKNGLKSNNNKTQRTSINISKESKLNCGNITFFGSEKKLWKNFTVKNYEFKDINSENHLYFIEDCSSISVSPDERVYLFREVLSDNIQDNYDYYEAPYIGFDTKTQGVANYVGVIDKKIQFLSLSSAKADFANQHDFIFENNIYYLSDELLKQIPKLIKNNSLIFNIDDVKEYLNNEPLSENNIKEYNDVAYYLSEKKKYEESIFLLKIITNNFPNRVVAYLNLADSYWSIDNKEKAKESYKKYAELMKNQQKDLTKIPQRVYERMK